MMIWLSLFLTIASCGYTAFVLLYQYPIVWILLPIALLASLVTIRRRASTTGMDLVSIVAVLAVPVFSTIGIAIRIGTAAASTQGVLLLASYLLVGAVIFLGLFYCQRLERGKKDST
jgi:hypothetical protein